MSTGLFGKHSGISTHYKWNISTNQLQLMSGTGACSGKFRIFIVGHGNTSCLTIAGFTGFQVADKLNTVLMSRMVFSVKRVSVVGCFSTVWKAEDDEEKQSQEYQNRLKYNFARMLHLRLGHTHSFYTEVSARSACVWVKSVLAQREPEFE